VIEKAVYWKILPAKPSNPSLPDILNKHVS